MRLETYEDLEALAPADALALGFVGNSDGVCAERAETGDRLLREFGDDLSGGNTLDDVDGVSDELFLDRMTQTVPSLAIIDAVVKHQGDVVGALYELEGQATEFERLPESTQSDRYFRPPLTTAQVRHLRGEVIAPMPPPAPRAQVNDLVAAHERLDALRNQARRGSDPVGSVRQLSIEATTFENTYGFPPGENRSVVRLEQYLAAGAEASGQAARVGMAAQTAQQAVTAASDHFARVSEHEPPTSGRFRAAERSLERLQQIQDRINVTSYAGWGVDGLTLDREERALSQAEQVHRDRVSRGIDVEAPGADEAFAYYEVGAVFDALAISRAAQGQVNIIEPVFGTGSQPAVRLEGPAPRVGMDEAQETVIVRRSTDGDMVTDIETSGPGANDGATRYSVTDRGEIARVLGVDKPTATATVAVAYGELERTRAHVEQATRPGPAPQTADEQPQAVKELAVDDSARQTPSYRDVLRHQLPLADIMRFGVEGNNTEQRLQRVQNAQQVLDEYQEADTRAYENAAGSGSLEDPGLPRPAAADLVIAHDGDVQGAVHDPRFTDVVADHEGLTSGLEFIDDEDGFREEYVEREVEPAWVEQQRSAVLDGVPHPERLSEEFHA